MTRQVWLSCGSRRFGLHFCPLCYSKSSLGPLLCPQEGLSPSSLDQLKSVSAPRSPAISPVKSQGLDVSLSSLSHTPSGGRSAQFQLFPCPLDGRSSTVFMPNALLTAVQLTSLDLIRMRAQHLCLRMTLPSPPQVPMRLFKYDPSD